MSHSEQYMLHCNPEDIMKILNNHIKYLCICQEISTCCSIYSYICVSCGSFNQCDGIRCDICGCGLCESCCNHSFNKFIKDYTRSICHTVDCYFCSHGTCYNNTYGYMCESCYKAVGSELDFDYSSSDE